MENIKEISVFVDEPGSFVPESQDSSSRHYLLCMVFHDQSVSIAEEIVRLENSLEQMGLPREHCVHAGPLVRRENEYASMSREERRGVLRRMFLFLQKADIAYRCFHVDKHLNTRQDAIHDSLLQEIVSFLIESKSEFDKYSKLKIYYDNGQSQVKEVLAQAFAIYSSKVEFVPSVSPDRYRLFQAADLACTIELMQCKLAAQCPLTESEWVFFRGEKNLKKNFFKPLHRKMFGKSEVAANPLIGDV